MYLRNSVSNVKKDSTLLNKLKSELNVYDNEKIFDMLAICSKQNIFMNDVQRIVI